MGKRMAWFLIFSCLATSIIGAPGCDSDSDVEIIESGPFYYENQHVWQKMTVAAEEHPIFVNPEGIQAINLFDNFGTFHLVCLHHLDPGRQLPGMFEMMAKTAFKNHGSMIADCSNAGIAPKFSLGPTHRFVNSGTMFFGVGGQPRDTETEESFFVLDPKEDTDIKVSAERIHNYGLLIFSGSVTRLVLAYLEVIDNHRHGVLYNRGSILLKHAVWEISQEMRGDGCIVLKKDSRVILALPAKMDPSMTFFFTPNTGDSMIDIILDDHVISFELHVRGFSHGNAIRFSRRMNLMQVSQAGIFHFGFSDRMGFVKIVLTDLRLRDFLFDGVTLMSSREFSRPVLAENCKYETGAVRLKIRTAQVYLGKDNFD